jgi:hypothetical protein
VETQRYADEGFTLQIARYLKAQDAFVAMLEKQRDTVIADA